MLLCVDELHALAVSNHHHSRHVELDRCLVLHVDHTFWLEVELPPATLEGQRALET